MVGRSNKGQGTERRSIASDSVNAGHGGART